MTKRTLVTVGFLICKLAPLLILILKEELVLEGSKEGLLNQKILLLVRGGLTPEDIWMQKVGVICFFDSYLVFII